MRALLFSICFLSYGIAQNENIIISFPELPVLYEGYDNLIQVGFVSKKEKQLTIECRGCDTIKLIDSDLNHYVIRPGETDKVQLTVKDKRNRKLHDFEYRVVKVPRPFLIIDGNESNQKLVEVPSKLALKTRSDVPIIASYPIIKWKIIIGDKEFTGSFSDVSDKVKSHIRALEKGLVIIEVEYSWVYGREFVREVFEFEIKK